MDWTQFSLFAISVFGMFLWNRSESRSDIRQITALIDSIHTEMKDFYGRLCALDERSRK